MARSRAALDQADLVLLVCDGSLGLTEADRTLLAQAAGRTDTLVVANKCDLPGAVPFSPPANAAGVVTLSAKTGQGMAGLEEALAQLAQRAFPQTQAAAAGALLTNRRQTEAVDRAAQAVARAAEALAAGMTPDALLTDVEQAMAALGELTGKTVREDITRRIFERFCVGK